MNIREGIHTALATSITVAEAAKTWIETIEREGRERATLVQYRQHVAQSHLGPVRLAALTTPAIAAFRDALLANGSRAMARKVLGTCSRAVTTALLTGCGER